MKRNPGLLRFVGIGAAAFLLWLSTPLFAAKEALEDHHWAIVGSAAQRLVELRVLVTNTRESAFAYRVRFTVERAYPAVPGTEGPPDGGATPAGVRAVAFRPGAAAAAVGGKVAARADSPEWQTVESSVVPGGPLAGNASEEVIAQFPESALRSGVPHRLRAELQEVASEAVLADVVVTRKRDRSGAGWLRPALVAALAGGGGGGLGGGEPGPRRETLEPMSGSGMMAGTHEARRVGTEWIEHGSGTIKIRGEGWAMAIDYTYDSHGTNAAVLTAVATGTGTASLPGRPLLPVTITSATAQMRHGGDRRQTGSLVTRTGSIATGTFEGTVGETRYQGVLTMTNGTQTLDLATGRGEHQFNIEFSAAR